MTRRHDMTGTRAGRWTVVSPAPYDGKRRSAYWLCRCDCGTEREVDGTRLRDGKSLSCGCAKPAAIGAAHVKHGWYGTKTYRAWQGMQQRCDNARCKDYPRYGGRGIRVCDRWRSFNSFLADMGEAPPGTSLDRIENDRGYGPGNCRWTSAVTQGNNKRNNRRVTFRDRTLTVSEWARETGIGLATLFNRLNRFGWTPERALSTPARSKRA